MASSDGVLPDFGTTYSNDIAAISAQQSSISMVVFDEKTHQIIYHNDQCLENNRPYLADPSKSSYVGDDFISVYQINERAHIRHILERGVAELQKTPKATFVAFGWMPINFKPRLGGIVILICISNGLTWAVLQNGSPITVLNILIKRRFRFSPHHHHGPRAMKRPWISASPRRIRMCR